MTHGGVIESERQAIGSKRERAKRGLSEVLKAEGFDRPGIEAVLNAIDTIVDAAIEDHERKSHA